MQNKSYIGKSFESGKTILLSRDRLFKGLVLLDECLHLVDGVLLDKLDR